jgi:multiple sugar transport system substrate-binding protein
MTSSIHLTGITWNHSRGFCPVVATAQRYQDLHPHVEITWSKRSLQEFADKPLVALADHFDFLVIDHPWAGWAAQSGKLVDLAKILPTTFLADQAANQVGRSHDSYHFDGGQWALAIDAATPVSASRPDLLEKAGAEMPRTWDQLLALGRKGLACCPSIPLDVYGNLLNILVSSGKKIFQTPEEIAHAEDALEALERLRELASFVPSEFFEINPIRACEAMTQTDRFAYCAYTYGYSNYSRPGFARRLLKFGPVVETAPGIKASTMLGGTGLAISSSCKNLDVAADYARFTASPEVQRGLYFENGGQPGHRSAWLDKQVNAASNDFFQATLPTLDAAFIRPRYNGYLGFQDHAGDPIHAWLREGGSTSASGVLEKINNLYRKSQPNP